MKSKFIFLSGFSTLQMLEVWWVFAWASALWQYSSWFGFFFNCFALFWCSRFYPRKWLWAKMMRRKTPNKKIMPGSSWLLFFSVKYNTCLEIKHILLLPNFETVTSNENHLQQKLFQLKLQKQYFAKVYQELKPSGALQIQLLNSLTSYLSSVLYLCTIFHLPIFC